MASVLDIFSLTSHFPMFQYSIPLIWLHISHCINVTHFLDSDIYLLATVNNIPLNIGLQRSVQISDDNSFEPVGTAGSFGTFVIP